MKPLSRDLIKNPWVASLCYSLPIEFRNAQRPSQVRLRRPRKTRGLCGGLSELFYCTVPYGGLTPPDSVRTARVWIKNYNSNEYCYLNLE